MRCWIGRSLGLYSPTGRLLVYGQAGDDNLQVAGSVAVGAWRFGDAGNDRLDAGNGSSVLGGGIADDLLIGGFGRDLLEGGLGADRLIGNGGDDLLIGGYLAFDRATLHWPQLWPNRLQNEK